MARYFSISSLKEEILSLRESLKQLELGRRNLSQHLQVDENNYLATFRQFVEKVSNLLLFRKDKLISLQVITVIWKLEFLVFMKTMLHFSA